MTDSQSPEDAKNTPAKTDDPFTVQLLGENGVRITHYLIYGLVFVFTIGVALPIYTVIRALVILVLDIVGIGHTLWDASDTVGTGGEIVTEALSQSLTDILVFSASVITAIIITSIVFYWNEVRYQRGEWFRTFL